MKFLSYQDSKNHDFLVTNPVWTLFCLKKALEGSWEGAQVIVWPRNMFPQTMFIISSFVSSQVIIILSLNRKVHFLPYFG